MPNEGVHSPSASTKCSVHRVGGAGAGGGVVIPRLSVWRRMSKHTPLVAVEQLQLFLLQVLLFVRHSCKE